MDHKHHVDGAAIQPSRDIECKKDPGFGVSTGRMRDQALRADLRRRRRRRSARERSQHVASPTLAGRELRVRPL